MRRRDRIAGTLALLVLVPSFAYAGEYGGHIKAQALVRSFGADELGAVPAGRDVDLESLTARTNAAWVRGVWDLTVQAQLGGWRGDLVRARRDPLVAAAGADAGWAVPGDAELLDARQVFDLGWNLVDEKDFISSAHLDRLSVGYSRGALTLRMGRQASSWGNGLVFQVLDLFDPFAPDALDTEYKPGVDMVHGQWLFANGDDLQLIVAPRRAGRGRPLNSSLSSVALKWRHFLGSYQVEAMGARHYRDSIAGLSLSGNLAGGVWRSDVSATIPDEGDAVASFLLNFDRSWVWGGRNVEGFAEFFRNGFGVTSVDDGVAALPSALLDRLDRGELFTVGRHELAAGLRYEWSPLTTLEPTALMNLNDGSAYLLAHLRHDWSENLELDAGAQIPVGGHGSEYGGVAVNGTDLWLTAGRTIWLRLARYF